MTTLMDAGVEQYHADLPRSEKTYYLPSGESVVVAAAPVRRGPAQHFSAAGVEAAVRAIQAGKITYHEFCERIAAAGCTGYFGRTAESYVEPFPGKV